MSARSRRLWLAIIGALIVIGTILRLAAIGRDSLWFDEAISYLAASLRLPDILANTIQDPHPPLYYGLLHYWLLWAPDSDGGIRLSSVLWNVLLIPLVYILTVELLDDKQVGVLAALLVTVSPFQILYSHELRMYTLLMFLVALMIFAYLKARRAGHWYWWILFTFLAALAIYVHLFAVFVLVAIGVYSMVYHRERHLLWRTIVVGLMLLILSIPWEILAVSNSQRSLGTLRPLAQDRHIDLNPLKPVTTPAFLIFGQADTVLYTGVVLFVTLAIGVVLLLEARKAKRAGQARGLVLPGLIVLCGIGLPVIVYLVRPFFLPERTMAAAAPFLMILLAWGTTRRGSPLPYLVYAAVAVMLVGSISYLVGDPIKPPYRAAMEYVSSERQPTDVVLHTSDGSYLPALRYVDFGNHAVLDGDPDPRKPEEVYEALGGQIWSLDQASAGVQRLWLIVALEHSLAWQTRQASYFADRYHLSRHRNFGGIDVYLYDIAGTKVADQ